MRWTFSIKNKLGASIVLLALCLLVLSSHYLDRLHTENVKSSISTLYEDRLIVEDYLLQMTRNIYQIREISGTEDYHSNERDVKKLIGDINSTYTIFIKTRLTENEKSTADELISQIKELEQNVPGGKNTVSLYTDAILLSLSKLSQIQLDESKLIMKQAEAQYSKIKASSQFAFAIVILILIVLQVMVFSGESIIPIYKPKDPSLN